jgi:peptidoglycan-associated lipoprotein
MMQIFYCKTERRFGMFGKRSLFVLAILLAVALPLVTASCARKQVQVEEGVAPSEVKPGERAGTGPGTGRPTEESLSAAERQRREAEAAFTNQDILFDYDKYDLSARAREILADKALFMKTFPTAKILIEGHCDERGTSEYNLALGERRANSAKQYLVHLGVAENRISTISYGRERPMDPGHSEASWAKNRRAHCVVVSR